LKRSPKLDEMEKIEFFDSMELFTKLDYSFSKSSFKKSIFWIDSLLKSLC